MAPQTNKSVKSLRHPAVSGLSRDFRTSRTISISCSSTNLHTQQLWYSNVLKPTLHSPKQVEK